MQYYNIDHIWSTGKSSVEYIFLTTVDFICFCPFNGLSITEKKFIKLKFHNGKNPNSHKIRSKITDDLHWLKVTLRNHQNVWSEHFLN